MEFDGLDKIAAKGQHLLDGHDSVDTHRSFTNWVSDVSRWLNDLYPDSGLSAKWVAQGNSPLVVAGSYHDDSLTWARFRTIVEGRLRWLGNLPLEVKINQLLAPAVAQNEAKQTGRKEIKLNTTSRAYVDPDRISELKAISSDDFDLRKLVRLCEELNICFSGECYISMLMLTRAILDHIPPIFNCSNATEITNNYSGGRSFKAAMQHLNNTSRKISDYYLHSQIKNSEMLPNVTQIDFSNDLDFLLAEIGRIVGKT